LRIYFEKAAPPKLSRMACRRKAKRRLRPLHIGQKSQRRLVTQRLAFLIAGFVTDEPVIKNQGVVLSRLF
jgi:hypothetical protein